MNIISLKYFIAVAECANFTKASERLFVSQPTLSRQIQGLEEMLGVRLFVRNRTSLALTPPGERLLTEAEAIVKRWDGLRQAVRQESDWVTGVVSIGYQSFLDTRIMYSTMKSLSGKYPGIDFVLSRGNPPDLRHDLIFGVCDIIFTLQTCVKSIPHVEAVKVADNRLQVAVPKTHRLADRESIDITELEGEHLIMLEHRVSPLTVDYVTGLFTKSGTAPEYTYHVDNAETALFLVGTGKGITFLHSRMSLDVLDDDAIRVLDIEGLEDELDYVTAYKTNCTNPLVPVFLSELRSRKAGV